MTFSHTYQLAEALRWQLCTELDAVLYVYTAHEPRQAFVTLPDSLCRTIGAAQGLLPGIDFLPKPDTVVPLRLLMSLRDYAANVSASVTEPSLAQQYQPQAAAPRTPGKRPLDDHVHVDVDGDLLCAEACTLDHGLKPAFSPCGARQSKRARRGQAPLVGDESELKVLLLGLAVDDSQQTQLSAARTYTTAMVCAVSPAMDMCGSS